MSKNLSAGNQNSWDDEIRQALVFHQQNDLINALSLYEKILSENPKHVDALHFKGVIALQRNQPSEAVKWIEQALALNRHMPLAYLNLGSAYRSLKEFNKALGCYEQVLKISPHLPAAFLNIGIIFYDLKDYSQAVDYFNQAITWDAHYVDAYFNRGHVHLYYHRYAEAVADYTTAIRINPAHVEAYLNRGQAYKGLGNYDAAIADFTRVIQFQTNNAEAYFHRGVTKITKNSANEEALEDLLKAQTINPHLKYLLGLIFYRKKQMCDWNNLEELGQSCLELTQNNVCTITPLGHSAHYDSLAGLKMITQAWSLNNYDPLENNRLQTETRQPEKDKEKITLGFFSANFSEHAVAYCSLGLFRNLDKNKFRLVGFYWGKHEDSYLQKISAHFDKFYKLGDVSDLEILQIARAEKLDIAIDLMGCTHECRPNIFLQQVAPVQVNYLGYPGTLGTELMHYIIADRVIIPASKQIFYSEKIAYLNCYLPHDNQLTLSSRTYDRASLNLPEGGFIFCAFNSSYKITRVMWNNWMTILDKVPGSVLWLSEMSPAAVENLKRAAVACGVDPQRLIFAPRWADVSEHMSRISSADLFLDTYPYNAHTTASTALWAGLPVLTKQGETFASRVASSLLLASQLPDLVVTSDEDYIQLAVDLALNPTRLQSIRKRLKDFQVTNPLFNTESYTRGLEDLFTQMYVKSIHGLAPQNISIQS